MILDTPVKRKAGSAREKEEKTEKEDKYLTSLPVTESNNSKHQTCLGDD